VRLVGEFLKVAMWTSGFTILGGSAALLVEVVCAAMLGWAPGHGFFGFGMYAGALLGFGWSVRRWYRRLHPVTEAEAEEELW
jgi:hypothetical protein